MIKVRHLIFLDKVLNIVEHVSREVHNSEAIPGVGVRAVVALGHDVMLVIAVQLLDLGQKLRVRTINHDLRERERARTDRGGRREKISTPTLRYFYIICERLDRN